MNLQIRDYISIANNNSAMHTVSLIRNQSLFLTQSVLEDCLNIERNYISPRYVYKKDNSVEPSYSHDSNTFLLAMAVSTDSHVMIDQWLPVEYFSVCS